MQRPFSVCRSAPLYTFENYLFSPKKFFCELDSSIYIKLFTSVDICTKEGKCDQPITDSQIKEYLSKLSVALDMKTLIEPVTHKSEKFGWAGWIHWDSSGCHFYAWNKPFPFYN